MKVKLGEVCELIRNGVSIKQLDNAQGIPITRIETISEKNVDRARMGYADIFDIEKYKDYVLQDQDILMSHINSEKHLGKSALYYKKNGEVIIHGMNLLVLRVKKDKALPIYANYYFNSETFRRNLVNITKKSVNQASFSVSSLKEIPFPQITIDEQIKIATKLEKIDFLIDLRKKQLEQLDLLVKARFVELFGNPLDGTAKYPIHQVGKIAESVDPQPSHRTPPVVENGIPYVSIKDCDYRTGTIDFAGARKVSVTVLEEHLKRYTIHNGDFVIGKIGTIGNPIFVPARNDYTLSANVVLVQPNSELVSPYFLKCSFESDFVERQFAEAKNSTSQAAFGIQKVRAIEVMNPDIDVQREFEQFVTQVDKSKLAVKQSLEKLELLKKALMQQYFG